MVDQMECAQKVQPYIRLKRHTVTWCTKKCHRHALSDVETGWQMSRCFA